MENFTFSYLCYLNGLTEDEANQYGLTRAELINSLTIKQAA